MKILLIDSVRALGGAQRSLLELAVALQGRGLQVDAAVPSGPLSAALAAAGIPVWHIPAVRLRHGWNSQALLERIRYLRALRVLARTLRTVMPDILHANGTTADRMAVFVRQQRPVVWQVRDFALKGLDLHHLSQRSTFIVGISDPVSEYLTEMVPASQLRKIRLIRSGVDTRHFVPGDRAAARSAFQLPATAPLVGMAAHLAPAKRHIFFLEVACAIRQTRPNVQFVIAGRDLFNIRPNLRAQIEARIASAGLTGAIHWIKNLDDLAPLYPALDVLVHPAADEPFGRVLCEAMSAGIPVIAVNRAGPHTIVPNNSAGFLLPSGDVELFARKILSLLDDPEAARQMGAIGRRHAMAHHDSARVGAEMHALYSKIQDILTRERRRLEDEKFRRTDDD